MHDEINDTCERSLPNLKSSEIADNVEVFFVAIVVALGIRAYIAQPFQIPTASMQPTLNGYRGEPTEEDPTRNIVSSFLGRVVGESYVNVISDHDGMINPAEPVTEHRFLYLFTYSTINFTDGHSIRVWCPKRQLMGSKKAEKDEERGLGMPEYLSARVIPNLGPDGKEVLTPDMNTETRLGGMDMHVKKGQLLARGVLHSGDHVLVNKFAYHFRAPKRGEVFVFTTRNIDSPYMQIPEEQGSQHYIKRLVGVPGDDLEVRSPELWINGKKAEEFGINRVAAAKTPYKGYGNTGFLSPGDHFQLAKDKYWAMGDNSYNSSDSRYWGPVPQRNLVGPGLFSYLPFASHWGVIR